MYMLNLSKKDLKWMQNSLDKKDIREFTKKFVVKDGYIYGTNGHVAYKMKCAQDEQNGEYDFNGVKLEASEMPHPLMKKDFFDTATFTNIVTGLSFDTRNLNILILSKHIGINKTYFNNAVNNSNSVNILSNEALDRIYITYDNREIIIMGCKR